MAQQAITLKIAGKSYSLNIESEKEEVYRLAMSFFCFVYLAASYSSAARVLVAALLPVRRPFSLFGPSEQCDAFVNLPHKTVDARPRFLPVAAFTRQSLRQLHA